MSKSQEQEEFEKAEKYLRSSLACATSEEPELMGLVPAKTLRFFLDGLDRLRAAIAKAEEGNAHHLERIERMAEERHLLHGRLEERFWGCSRLPCKAASAYLREQPSCVTCRARRAGTAGGNDPQDCDWPFCGCDPAATRVLTAIDDAGLTLVRHKEGTA